MSQINLIQLLPEKTSGAKFSNFCKRWISLCAMVYCYVWYGSETFPEILGNYSIDVFLNISLKDVWMNESVRFFS